MERCVVHLNKDVRQDELEHEGERVTVGLRVSVRERVSEQWNLSN